MENIKIFKTLHLIRYNANFDIPQRGIEYAALLSYAPNVIASVFIPIPSFEKKVSSLHHLVMEYKEEEEEEDVYSHMTPNRCQWSPHQHYPPHPLS